MPTGAISKLTPFTHAVDMALLKIPFVVAGRFDIFILGHMGTAKGGDDLRGISFTGVGVERTGEEVARV